MSYNKKANRSNYRRIGDFIQRVKNKNSDGTITRLLGINIDKYFMPSVANVVGTDLSKYKIVKPNQFACNRMHVGRDYRLPVALSKEKEPFIVSPAYDVFEILDSNVLLEEYLMMWFSRKEFDRNCWFHTDTDVRGKLGWDSLCDIELPIPSIEKQRAIVQEYQTITQRIQLNEQLNQKLEETAQAIYKHWFVDFEFPDENGMPYKSSGGEMVYNEELDMDIPKNWNVSLINNIIDTIISHRGKSKSHLDGKNYKNKIYCNPIISAKNIKGGKIVKKESIIYVNNQTLKEWMVTPLKYGDVLLTSEAPLGELLFISNKYNFLLSQRLFGIRANELKTKGIHLYFWLQTSTAKREMEGRSTGTTVQGIKLSELKKLLILCPPLELINLFNIHVSSLISLVETKNDENEINSSICQLLLSKMSKKKTSQQTVL